MEIRIREEHADDHAAVHDLIKSAFFDLPESDHREQYLVERLRKTDAFVPRLSLVAEDDERRIVGYILMTETKIVSDDCESVSLGVAPLAVLPEFQRRGIGGKLLSEAHARAAALGYGSAVLLGHKDYYTRFGYRKASDFGLKFTFDAPDECCMAIELRHEALADIRGTVHYHDTFGE